ncbi:hypothetical protein FKP32DRAFT_1597225 [Trametes sanguinea]|nr:hypothetical protein FKP32DRAFT_1597225 [Trametes sanguinea]
MPRELHARRWRLRLSASLLSHTHCKLRTLGPPSPDRPVRPFRLVGWHDLVPDAVSYFALRPDLCMICPHGVPTDVQ